MPAAVVSVGLRDRWYQAVKTGQKRIEGRLRGGRLAALGPGDPVEFRNACRQGDPAIAAKVTGVAPYPSFRAMLEAEGLPNVLPGVFGLDEGVAVYREFYPEGAEEKEGVAAVRFALAARPLTRNSTSFPVQATARLRDLHTAYVALQRQAAEAESAGGRPSGEDLAAAGLKYYQYLVRDVMSNPEYGLGEQGNARGLLVYHTMGLGKTRLAAAVAMALWDVRPPVVVAPKALQKNFAGTVEALVAMTRPELAGDALRGVQEAAVRRFRFVTLDAHNMATQVARATSGAEGSGALTNRLLIVDEAHNLFRGIINSPSEKSNARRLYEMVMEARNLRILFLTGTPASKDPFELVPCFNMLAGYDLLPTEYEVFYKHFVDKGGHGVRNRAKLANRLVGLVSHASHLLPGEPGGGDGGVDGAPASRELGGFPEEGAMVVERVEMAPEQYRQYLLAREKEEAEGKGGEGGPAPAARERIANSPPLALPGSEAGAGSTYYVRSRGLSNFSPPADLRTRPVAEMPDEAFSAETSPKAARLLANLARSPGPALVYSQFVGAGGLAVIARFLRNAGYSEYHPPATEAKWAAPPHEPGRPGGVAGGAGEPEATARGWSFAVISGEVAPEDRVKIQDAFNAPANAHGEIIRVLLVSKTGAEGLDLKGIRQVHVFEPYWDKSREDQVKARGVRMGSHDHLPVEEREVQPFLYIAVANGQMFEGMRASQAEKEAAPRRYRLVEEVTIDELFHARALGKHETNRAFRTLLREVSLECAVNGYGNCRLCVPSDAPLFHEDPIRDLRLPDPCQPLEEAEVAVQELELDGTVYYYQVDAGAPFGTRFFAYDEELRAHAPVDPSTGLFQRLLERLEGG